MGMRTVMPLSGANEVRWMVRQVQGSAHGSTATRKQVNHAYGGRFARYQITPPENVKKYEKIAWDITPPKEFFDELFRISKNQIIWGGNYFALPPTRCFIVWKKLSISEHFSMAMAEYAWTSFNANAKLFEHFPQSDKNDIRFHPTQKPVALYGDVLRCFAKEGDKIFDPMMGSQSSRLAAYKMGFDYTGCEIDADYYQKGERRFRRQCLGEVTNEKGDIIASQLSLF